MIWWLLTSWLLLAEVTWAQKPNIDAIMNRRQDVYIAGFFPFGKGIEQSSIGRGVMPSVKLALDHVNEHETVLRNYRLHMWWNDTECNAAVGVKSFFDMMHSGPHKLMLFGAACTHVTDPIAKASKYWHLTQLSYADTHPMFTKEAFPNFFRIVPSENAFNQPRLALLRHFNWTRIGTIYQNEPRYALAHNRLVSDLEAQNFTVVETQSFATEVRSALTKLKENDVRVILGNFNETWAIRIFCEAYRLDMYGRAYMWLIQGTYSKKWWKNTAKYGGGSCSRYQLTAALDTAILTDLLPLSTTGEVTVSGITAKDYEVEYDRRRGEEYSRFHGYTYDGVWAMALAIQTVAYRAKQTSKERGVADFRYRDKEWEQLFLEALANISFEGVTGPVRFYDNERRASILLKQFQGEDIGGEVKVGEYCSERNHLDLTVGQPFKWIGKYPPKDRTLRQIEHTQVNITIYSILASIAVLGILLAIGFLAMNIHYRNQRYIKMSSPHLNNLIIVGCMLTYMSVIFLGLDSGLSSIAAFPYICTARAWLLMAGFSLAFGAMFSKTWRVHSIFTDVKLNKKVIKDYQLFMVVGVLLGIDFAIMTTWQVADPFYRATKQLEPYSHPSHEDILIVRENEYCESEKMTIFIGIIYAYKGLLLVFGAFLAWETRSVSIPALNDSKHIGLSVYNVLIMCIMGAAIALVLTDHKDALFLLIAIFIIFCTTGTLCLVFVPKLLELRRNGDGAGGAGRIRATLRPPSSHKDCRSPGAELERRLKELRQTNNKFRKTLHAKENELQMLLSKLGSDATSLSSAKGSRTPPTNSGARLSVPSKEPTSHMDTSDLTSLCSLSGSQDAEDFLTHPPALEKPKPSAPPETPKDGTLKDQTKKEPITKNVSFKNHLDFSSSPQFGNSKTVPDKDQLAKLQYGWSSEVPKDQMQKPIEPKPALVQKEVMQTKTAPVTQSQAVIAESKMAQVVPECAVPVQTSQTVPDLAISRGHRRNSSIGQGLLLMEAPPLVPTTTVIERKIIGAESEPPPLVRQKQKFEETIDYDRDYGTMDRNKCPQRRDSERRKKENFIVVQSDLWDTNTFSYSPKPPNAHHTHTSIQRSVSEKRQQGSPHKSSRESERRSSNTSVRSITPEGYREAETLRMRDHQKRRGSDYPQPKSHHNHATRRQSPSQVKPFQPEQPLRLVPTLDSQVDEQLIGQGPRSRPQVPRLPQQTAKESARPSHHKSTPNVGTQLAKRETQSTTRTVRQDESMSAARSESELLEVAILPIFHKLVSERRQPHNLDMMLGLSCPNISIKCDIVEYL